MKELQLNPKSLIDITAHWKFLRCIVMFALAVALLPSATSQAITPHTPNAGGIFQVNTTGDSNAEDEYLTLREAILLANNGTDSAGLNRALSAGEQQWIQGCTISSGKITGGCGNNQPDLIKLSLKNAIYVIDSGKPLPNISDAAPTTIDGTISEAYPTVNVSFATDNQGLVLDSDVIIKGVNVKGAHCTSPGCSDRAAFSLLGNNNTLVSVGAYDSDHWGILIKGSGNLIDGAFVGVSPRPSGCAAPDTSADKGNNKAGIRLDAGAQNNTIKNSWIGCNGNIGNWAGISIDDSAGSNNTVGPNNRIGTTTGAATINIGNYGAGVTVQSSANMVISNTIGHNKQSGVAVYSNGNNNKIAGNTIRSNHYAGIELYQAVSGNIIGGPSSGNPYGGNRIGGNSNNGIWLHELIDAPAPSGTLIVGNWIGTFDGATVVSNTLSGIHISRGSNNTIGSSVYEPNIIVGNGHSGITLDGASDTNILNNLIGTNGVDALGNAVNGITIQNGASDNIVGGLGTGRNYIEHNAIAGVLIEGLDTTTNTVQSNLIRFNGERGVEISSGAHHNTIGGQPPLGALVPNEILGSSDGIKVYDAHHNLITWNNIHTIGGTGVWFLGLSATQNIVEYTTIHDNGNDGISENGGATDNVWTQVSIYNNDSLGIDKLADDLATSPYPTITQIITGPGNAHTFKGIASASNGFVSSVRVEIYRSTADESGYGQGQTYLGSGSTDASGNFTITVTTLPGCFTATETRTTLFVGKSSEFGPNLCNAAAQNISLAPIISKFVLDPPFLITPTASSGLPVTLMATSDSKCSVSGYTVSISNTFGNCTLVASQAGNETFAPAPMITQTFMVKRLPQNIVINPIPVKLTTDAPFSVSVTISPNTGLPVHYFVGEGGSGSDVCGISGNSIALTGIVGDCLIGAHIDSDQTYQSDTGYYLVPVTSPSLLSQTITFGPLTDKQVGDPSFDISATATSGLPVVFNSEGACNVAGTTVGLGNQSGVCIITASQPGNDAYNAAPDVVRSFNVLDPAKQNQSISFSALPDRHLGDAAFDVTASASSNLAVFFTAQPNTVCTIQNTTVSLLGAGTCTITALQPGNATFNPAPSVSQSFAVVGNTSSSIYLPMLQR